MDTDTKVDTIYIPLPNHLHLENTIKALKSGKHVLFENPGTINATELQTLSRMAREAFSINVEGAFLLVQKFLYSQNSLKS